MANFFSTYKKVIVNTIIVTLIIFVAFCIVYGLITGSIGRFLSTLADVLSPITIGLVMAYLMNPIVVFFENRIFRWGGSFGFKRLLAIICTLLLFLLLIAFLVAILIPSIASTLESFWTTYVVNYKETVYSICESLNEFLDGFHAFDTAKRIDPLAVLNWVEDKFPWLDKIVVGDISGLLPDDSLISDGSGSMINIAEIFTTQNIIKMLVYAFSLGTSVINVAADIILGIFIAVYVLFSKEKCKAGIRRLLNSFLSPKSVRSVIRFTKLLDSSFGGFIEGQLLDALIVGVVSYFVFLVFGIPIPHLIATIIAVTNVIPILGPFIGGIPAAFLVFLTAPEKTILFIVLIIVIQQIDGNVICPHILGDRINISSLATIIAIVTMGGLFGIFGMLIGVPVFAVIIHLVNTYTMNSLRKKGYETSLTDYYVGDVRKISSKQANNKRNFKLSNIKLLRKEKNKSKEEK